MRTLALAKTVAGVIVALVVAEGVVRQHYTLSYVYEDGLGWVHAPGVARWGKEGDASSTWTAHGIRRPAPLREGEPVVLALGDSFTEALQVEDDQVWTARLEADLRAHGRNVQIANAGRSTQSLADYVVHAQRYRELFAPRWVTVEVGAEDLAEDAWIASRAHFERKDDGTLGVVDVPDPKFTGLRDRVWGWRQRSMLLGAGFARVTEIRTVAAKEPPLFHAGASHTAPPAERRSFPIEEELDLLFDAYAGRVTVLFVAAYDPSSPMTASAEEERVLAHCSARAMSCASIREAFSRIPPGAAPFGFPNSGFNVGHLNALGHALCAEVGARALERVNALL